MLARPETERGQCTHGQAHRYRQQGSRSIVFGARGIHHRSRRGEPDSRLPASIGRARPMDDLRVDRVPGLVHGHDAPAYRVSDRRSDLRYRRWPKPFPRPVRERAGLHHPAAPRRWQTIRATASHRGDRPEVPVYRPLAGVHERTADRPLRARIDTPLRRHPPHDADDPRGARAPRTTCSRSTSSAITTRS